MTDRLLSRIRVGDTDLATARREGTLTPHQQEVLDHLSGPLSPADHELFGWLANQDVHTVRLDSRVNAANSVSNVGDRVLNPEILVGTNGQQGMSRGRFALGLEGAQIPNTDWRHILRHEATHAYDFHQNGMGVGADGTATRILQEYHCNLNGQGDHAQALHVTDLSYTMDPVLQQHDLWGHSPETIYGALGAAHQNAADPAAAARAVSDHVAQSGGTRLAPSEPGYAFPGLPEGAANVAQGETVRMRRTLPDGQQAEFDLHQVPGTMAGRSGMFEWIVSPSGQMLGRTFVPGGTPNGHVSSGEYPGHNFEAIDMARWEPASGQAAAAAAPATP